MSKSRGMTTNLVGRRVLYRLPIDEQSPEQLSKIQAAGAYTEIERATDPSNPEIQKAREARVSEAWPHVEVEIVTVFLDENGVGPQYTIVLPNGRLRDVTASTIKVWP